MRLVFGQTIQAAAGGPPPAGFISFRSAGTRYFGPTDGVGPFALAKPPGYQAGDLLVVALQSTFWTGTSPVENPGPWIQIINNSQQRVFYRIATGDANDDFTIAATSTTGAGTGQMAAFDLSAGPYGSVAFVAGGTLLSNDSSYGTAFPAPGFSQYNNDQSLTLAFWHKSTNTSIGAGAVTDNLPGVVTGANAIGTIGSYAFDGLNGNPGGNRSSWGGWTYWITDGNPADAVAFGTDQTEVPESSGFEVVSHYGARLRITF